jgi:4-carboxymuconolactone decarboxylase
MPRIAPLETAPGDGLLALNIFRTLAKQPKMLEGIQRLGGFLLSGVGLPAREREIVVLRVGWRSGSVYEFGQHTVIGLREGLAEDEIVRLAQPSLEGWSAGDEVLVRFADELCETNDVTDATWAELASRWTEPQLIELVVLAGFYRLISGFLNTMRVELDPGVPGWPT